MPSLLMQSSQVSAEELGDIDDVPLCPQEVAPVARTVDERRRVFSVQPVSGVSCMAAPGIGGRTPEPVSGTCRSERRTTLHGTPAGAVARSLCATGFPGRTAGQEITWRGVHDD